MPFKRFVETGRVALITDGPHKGKLASIIDVIDQTRVLIDGPITDVPRGQIRINQLHLTKFRLRYPYTAPTRLVRKAWNDAKIKKKWSETLWAKKLEAKKKRAELCDFDRFKLRKARQQRNKLRTRVFFNLRKIASRNGTLYGRKAKGGNKPKPKKDKQKKVPAEKKQKKKVEKKSPSEKKVTEKKVEAK